MNFVTKLTLKFLKDLHSGGVIETHSPKFISLLLILILYCIADLS